MTNPKPLQPVHIMPRKRTMIEQGVQYVGGGCVEGAVHSCYQEGASALACDKLLKRLALKRQEKT
jgi:hypothetical protein